MMTIAIRSTKGVVMSRTYRCAVLLSLAVLGGPGVARAEPLYAATFLPQDFHAAAINNAGQVVGTADGGAAIWSSPSSTVSLAALLPGSEGLGINNHGDIVGRYGASAFVHAGGVTTSIATGYHSWATGINDAGQVTGTATTSAIGGPQSGFVYSGGTTTFLGTDFPFSGENFANAINNAGTVVGTAAFGGHWSNPDRQAFLFTPPGDGFLLGRGTLGGSISEGLDINDAGSFVGWSTNYEGSDELAMMYTEQYGLQPLGSLGGTSSRALGLNNLGWAVGMSDVDGGEGFDYHAFLYREHGMVDLNGLVAPLDGWLLVSAQDVNDAGQILARACAAASGDCRFVRLDMIAQVPEPSAWAMLLAGVGVLARAAGRRRRAGLAVAGLLATAGAAHAGNEYEFVMTAVPSGFAARAINNAGVIVGTMREGDLGQAAATWDGQRIVTIADLAPGSVGIGINDRGHIVGAWHGAFVRTPAGVRDLGRLGWWASSEADAINDGGDVAGAPGWSRRASCA
jgi:probable HAF family extracellular repeat protein